MTEAREIILLQTFTDTNLSSTPPNWTYAQIFFLAFSLDDLPKQAWLEWGLLAFLLLLLANNGLFLRLVAGNLSPVFSHPRRLNPPPRPNEA
jgi:hypothetical protein